MTYIIENIIAMGFPKSDMSSGIFGYVEVKIAHNYFFINFPLIPDLHFSNISDWMILGFHRNHMEEVINFFETHHQSRECSMVAVKVAAHHDVFMDLQLPTSIRTISVCTGLSEIVGLECTQR